ncbi:MAG: MoaD/ThiS family protein [Rhodospirillaceae bacterium]|jgi:sulfur carrier protein ThiS|nr:MoaD/ThiS family protein [Rhodospirillaceae bacterium]MBT6203580.1 MoaD/ThiS family protein [Rhodospirillaceae bacterium]MBT7615377.1 MoaD/ThiS family protein [Rhodospirillaceae bacterium]
MKILVRTAGLLGKHLPAGSEKNRAEIELPEGLTPRVVMDRLGFPEGSYLVTLNGKAVPTAKRMEVILQDGDNLALMPPLKGG